MSDFDREAAREELREKFERDNEKRKTTQRMSELLLKGATMTNRHCDDCGDPIFRYQGQEFCATCQNATVDGGPDSVQDHATDDVDAGAVEPSSQPDAADGDHRVEASEAVPEPAESVPNATESSGSAVDAPERTANGRRRPTDRESLGADDVTAQPTPEPRPTDQRQAESTTGGEPAPTTDHGETGDVAVARASLTRTLTRYSREAEAADDPRRARELLSVAREAAETLAAVDRTR